MPFAPYLEPMQKKKMRTHMQDRFLGLCMRETADASQFVDESWLSSDEYPYLSQERPHKCIRLLINPRGLLGGECLSWVADGHLYYDGKQVCSVSSDRPQLVRMGAYLIVWPDKIIYNTQSGELSSMDATKTCTGVSVCPCTLSGAEYNYTASDSPPTSPKKGSYWYNTLNKGFYQYLGKEQGWHGIDTVYSKLEGPDLGKQFQAYDVVKISGFSYKDLNLDAATVYGRGNDYIVIATGTLRDFDEENAVTIKRAAPAMDYICENGNRLWGCSSAKHEIYGSKLGDPTNWNSYLGISTDSYAATVGSEGHFTGICAYMGYVLFWKENRCHRLYGTRPENYQLVELPIRGVKTGCDRSLCICNGILYYVNREGVMGFDGASPVNIGDVLGDAILENAVAGAHADKVYVSCHMTKAGTNRGDVTLVMDTKRGLWHMLQDKYAIGYANTPEGDFYLQGSALGTIYMIGGGTSKYEDPEDASTDEYVEWYGVTGDYGMDAPNQKFLHKLTLRLKAERSARLNIYIMYDSDGTWNRIYTYQATGKEYGDRADDVFKAPRKKSETIQLRTRRCDHFKLGYEGTGRVIITSITVVRDEGSERSV